jgi:hypothetical protein
VHKNRICVPSSIELSNLVLKEMHNVPYVVHSSYHKKIAVVRSQFFWPWMKRDIVDYIAKFKECQRVKVDHRHPTVFLQPLPILEKKWEVVIVDFCNKISHERKTT